MANGTAPRPLSELSPMANRRNSPTWHVSTKASITSSPFESSPFNNASSTRLFWQGRDSNSSFQSMSGENKSPYDPEGSYTPAKRPSIENLKRASRVKNSSIIAREQKHEYDPTNIQTVDRPLSSTHSFQSPLNMSKSSLSPLRKNGQNQRVGEDSPSGKHLQRPASPSKNVISPAKSSLSKGTRFDPESHIWDDSNGATYPQRFSDGQSRGPKSVTFDAAPPQINEYEMTTPDPSSVASGSREGSYEYDDEEGDISFDRSMSFDIEDSFDASLEDTEKTPVVLPEDWRFMSPVSANDELVHGEDDPFVEGSPSPNAVPTSRHETGLRHGRIESLDSNGERRPLPPLPSPGVNESPNWPDTSIPRGHANGSSQRVLPSPPKTTSPTNSDISGLAQSALNLEERLRLMMLKEHDQKAMQTEVDKQRERRMRRAGARNRNQGQDSEGYQSRETTVERELATPPPISRESILRNMKDNRNISGHGSLEQSAQEGSSPTPSAGYDPDVPLPSLENDDSEEPVELVKGEQSDEEKDLYSIPAYYDGREYGFDDDIDEDEDDDEIYETDNLPRVSVDGQSTPMPSKESELSPRISDANIIHDSQSPFGLSPAKTQATNAAHTLNETNFKDSQQRALTPGSESAELEDEPSTPDSVIRHPIGEDEDDISDLESIPEPVATIKAPGSSLRARPSLAPADLQTMAATRRKVSSQEVPLPALTASSADPAEYTGVADSAEVDQQSSTLQGSVNANRQSSLVMLDIPLDAADESLSFGLDKEFDRVIEAQKVVFKLSLSQYQTHFDSALRPRMDSMNSPSYQAGHPSYQGPNSHVCIPLANIDSPQQRGYLMRQNTKVIVASSRADDDTNQTQRGNETQTLDTPAASPSPRKTSQSTWTSEPWNGKIRRQSVKMAGGAVRKKPVSGAVPPLPNMPSNVQASHTQTEETDQNTINEETEGDERGRLFVKVVGIRDLDLPLPRGEHTAFALTLDNGLHCVTTSWLELGRSAPIGQEFELIVQKDLEFQLTLQMKTEGTPLVQPKEPARPSSPTKQKSSAFSRVFTSPKKRKEMELKQMEQQKQDKDNKAYSPAWDKLRAIVDREGSFARAYIALSDHEKYAFGRPYTVHISCFNEWAIEDTSSVKNKKSSSTGLVQRRPPYKIGNLELQLLYVPKPKGSKEEDMPKSMNACIREMREAENTAVRSWEGFLSQQGGDCPYWRRRFFRLQGSKLTAYHEMTRQPRATINLAKATKLIDDKSALTQKETSTKGGGRRKSAFAEEEEGYMFVEEGFRIRFANGEVIDFYADSRPEKDGWMRVLSETVGKGYAAGNGNVKAWTELVLRHERAHNAKRDTADRLLGLGPPPTGPAKRESHVPVGMRSSGPHSPSRPLYQHHYSRSEARSSETRREKARSMAF